VRTVLILEIPRRPLEEILQKPGAMGHALRCLRCSILLFAFLYKGLTQESYIITLENDLLKQNERRLVAMKWDLKHE
jgi:hypothetical protein